MGIITYMGLVINIIETDHKNSKKDGFIDIITPDGMVKLHFEVTKNHGRAFKYIKSVEDIEDFAKFERAMAGLFGAFIEAEVCKESEIAGFRFFDRPINNISSIHVTRYRNERNSYDVRFDFVQPIIHPEVKARIKEMNLARKKKRLEEQQRINEANGVVAKETKPPQKKKFHNKPFVKPQPPAIVKPTPVPEEEVSEPKPANDSQLLELAERFKRS